jgi:hypothetical protein
MSFWFPVSHIAPSLLRLTAAALTAAAMACSPAPNSTEAKPPLKQSSLLTLIIHEELSKEKALIPMLSKDKLRSKFERYGAEIISWRVALGLGEIITVRVPAGELRTVHRDVAALQSGSLQIGYYPTYESYSTAKP